MGAWQSELGNCHCVVPLIGNFNGTLPISGCRVVLSENQHCLRQFPDAADRVDVSMANLATVFMDGLCAEVSGPARCWHLAESGLYAPAPGRIVAPSMTARQEGPMTVPHRLNAPDRDELETLAHRLANEAGTTFIVQFSSPEQYPADVLQLLDDLCARYAERIDVRFYGHYADACFDGHTLQALPHVRVLTLDCLYQFTGLEAIKALAHLSSLAIGVEKFDLNPVVAFENLQTLCELRLSQFTGPKLDLAPVSTMSRLHALHLSAPAQGLEPLRQHAALATLSLYRQPATMTFEGVSTLAGLKDLSIGFGSRKAMPELCSDSVERMSLLRVRGLGQFDPGRFPGLQALEIEDQPHLQDLVIEHTPGLHTLKLSNLKALSNLQGLGQSSLAHLEVYKTPALDLLGLLNGPLPALESLKLISGKRKLDEQIMARQNALGIPRPVFGPA